MKTLDIWIPEGWHESDENIVIATRLFQKGTLSEKSIFGYDEKRESEKAIGFRRKNQWCWIPKSAIENFRQKETRYFFDVKEWFDSQFADKVETYCWRTID